MYIYTYITLQMRYQSEVWLRERGYSDKLVRQQILKARTHKRKDLLNNMKDKRNDYQLVFNITYHPNFSKLKDTMSFFHLLFTPDQEHQNAFHKVAIIGFRRGKSLKDILVRAKVPHFKKMKGFVDHVRNQDVKFVSTW